MTTPWVSPARVRARDITAALRLLYPRGPLSTTEQEDGTFLVQMPEANARYWGAERDPQHAAALIAYKLPRPVEVRGVRLDKQASGTTALVTLAVSDRPRPADPDCIPIYTTVDEVIGDFPATRPVRALIQAALDGGLRPRLHPSRSPHGPRYRVELQGTGKSSLLGVLDISETKGQFAEAWLIQGSGPERRYRRNESGLVRKEINAARDQYRAETASLGPGRGGRTSNPSAGPTSVASSAVARNADASSRSAGSAASRRRPAGTTRAAQQARPRGLR